MKRMRTLLTAAALALSSMCSAAVCAGGMTANAADPVRIMPIGDSITFGYGEDGGYRKYLDYALRADGIGFDMVGPEGRNSASFSYNGQSVTYDDNHAGYSGYTIKQQYPIPSWGENGLYEKLKAKDAVKNARPDIVLLIIGTNDMTANRSLSDCETDLHTLIDYIRSDLPEGSTVFMGSIPEFTAYGGNSQRVGNYNNTVKKVAESYGDDVRFADVHGCLNGTADLQSDNLHPSGAGYEKMGKFWAGVIGDYLEERNSSSYDPDDPVILHSDFERGLSGWQNRGGAGVAVSQGSAFEGVQSALVSGRTAAWQGIAYALPGSRCPEGTYLTVQAQVMQNTNAAVHFKMTMQYDTDDGAVYDTFAEGDAKPGEWLTLSAADYKVKSGMNPVLYFETDTDTCDFYLDDVTVTVTDGSAAQQTYQKGDADHDGGVTVADITALFRFLLAEESTVFLDTADLNGDGKLNAKDLTLLKRLLTDPTPLEPDGKAYMNSIRSQLTAGVPSSALQSAEGTLTHITYFSKKANHDKGANIWLPPGFDSSRKYPVLYVNHGYGGDENAMVNGNGIREIATNLIKSGDAEPMIIVFTAQYTNPDRMTESGSGSADVPFYDAFAEDLPDSLMPYIESHYPVKTGRENTAVAGFSMGGRESLYIGMKCCDKIGYIGAGAPAPGIFPTKDQFMDHPGVMSKDDLRIDPPYSPYVLMIAGGTSDGMVGDYPKTYADLFTEHGTDNIFISVPGGGHDSSTVTPLMYNFIRCLFKA
jgi:glucuronoarabinoxylan endo-1,4-beta-xylanase